MNHFIAWTVLITASLSSASLLSAAEKTPFYSLSRQYETSVQRFRSSVQNLRGIDRNDKRLVDRLEKSSVQLRLAARNPRHMNRLFHQWQEVRKLHEQVEERIFGKYTPNHDLNRSWYAVTYYYALFAEEYFYDVENPRHDGTVQRTPAQSARRTSYLQSTDPLPQFPTPRITLPIPR